MNRKQMLLNEIQAVLQPQDTYYIQHVATGLFYRAEDYDLSICQPIPGAKGKELKKEGEIFKLPGCKVFF